MLGQGPIQSWNKKTDQGISSYYKVKAILIEGKWNNSEINSWKSDSEQNTKRVLREPVELW